MLIFCGVVLKGREEALVLGRIFRARRGQEDVAWTRSWNELGEKMPKTEMYFSFTSCPITLPPTFLRSMFQSRFVNIPVRIHTYGKVCM